jgi:hypothetical protein
MRATTSRTICSLSDSPEVRDSSAAAALDDGGKLGALGAGSVLFMSPLQ